MTDGLSQLAGRGSCTRGDSPLRNPDRRAPVQLTSVPGLTAQEEQAAAVPAVGAPAAEQAEVVEATEAELKVVTVYLQQDDDFLVTITHTGRTSQPKTAISRSAIVRLALERLQAQLSPGQIVDDLRPRGDTSGTGRKRR